MGSGGNSLFFGETGFKGSIPPYQRGGYPNNTAGYYGPNPMGGFPMANSNLGYPYSGGIGSFGNPYNQPPPPPTPYQNPYQVGYGYSPPRYFGSRQFMPSFNQQPPRPTAQTLDDITKEYTQNFNDYIGGGGDEQQFVEGPQFRSFENRLINTIGGLTDRDRLNTDLEAQRKRSTEGSLYSPSAGRITQAIERRLNQLGPETPEENSFNEPPSFYRALPPSYSMGIGGFPMGVGSSIFSRIPSYYGMPRSLPYQRYGTTPGGYDFIGGVPADQVTYQPIEPTPQESDPELTGTTPDGSVTNDMTNFFSNLGGTGEGIIERDGEYYFQYPGDSDLQGGVGEVKIPMTPELKEYLVGIGALAPDGTQETTQTTENNTEDAATDAATTAPETQTTDTAPEETAPRSYDVQQTFDLSGRDRSGINEEYSNQYRQAIDAGFSEAEWVQSPAFRSFEEAIVNNYKETNDPAVMRAEAERQRARTGTYADSGGRIANELEQAASMIDYQNAIQGAV